MSTFSQNVQKVKDAFAKIKTALTGKGVTVPSRCVAGSELPTTMPYTAGTRSQKAL